MQALEWALERERTPFDPLTDLLAVPPEQAAEIQQRLLTSSVDAEASIGLYNTNARIKLLYGDEYGISFSSVHGTGTSVTITTPFNPPGKESAT